MTFDEYVKQNRNKTASNKGMTFDEYVKNYDTINKTQNTVRGNPVQTQTGSLASYLPAPASSEAERRNYAAQMQRAQRDALSASPSQDKTEKEKRDIIRAYKSARLSANARMLGGENADDVLADVNAKYLAAKPYMNTLGNVGRSAAGAAVQSSAGLVNYLPYQGQIDAQAAAQQTVTDLQLLKNLGLLKDENGEIISETKRFADALSEKPLEAAVHWGDNYVAETQERTKDVGRVGRIVNDIASGVGGMAPSIVAGALTGGQASLPVMFAYASANATKEAAENGASRENAIIYGNAVGAVEVLTEKMFSGVPFMGKGSVDDAVDGVIKKIASNAYTAYALKYLTDAVGEGIEEFVSEFADAGLNKVFVGTDKRSLKEVTKDAGYAFLIAALTSAVMQTAQIPSNLRNAKYIADLTRRNLELAQTYFPEMTSEEAKARYQQYMSEIPENDPRGAEINVAYDVFKGVPDGVKIPPAEIGNTETAQQNTEQGATRAQIDEIVKDRTALAAIGIDANGKTNSQLRAEVRARLNAENTEPVSRNAEAPKTSQRRYIMPTATEPGYFENAATDAKNAPLGNQQSVNTTENGEELFNGREQSVGGEERTGGLAATEQSESVAGVQTEAGNVRAGESNVRQDLQSDYVGGVKLGIETAVSPEEDQTKTLREETDYDDDQKAIIEYGRKRGHTVRFYRGDLWVKDSPDGSPYLVRGLIHSDGKTIWVKTDHSQYSAKQIYMHEDFHAAVKSNPEVLKKGIRKLKRKYANDPAGLRALIDRYVEKYHIEDTNLSDEYILEEILADAHAGIALDTKTRSGRAQALDEKTTAKIKKAADKAINKRASGNAADARTKYSINESYKDDISEWVRNGKRNGETFILGATGDVLQGLGAIENDIYMVSDKVNSILSDHPEMTIDEIKRIPEILDDPILVLKSKGKRKGKNSRLVIFGSIKASNGKPVLSVLDLIPTEGKLRIDDMQKVNSAYTKTGNAEDFILTSEVLHADKKRTIPLLRSIGLTITSQELLRSGSIGSINYRGGNVNINGTPMSEVISTNQLNENSMAKAAPAVTSAKGAEFQNGPQAASAKNTTRTSRESQEKYSEPKPVSKEADAEYLSLAADPEKNKAELQRMVYEAAKAAGYDYHLYHGTNAAFTVFDIRKNGGKNGKGEGYGIYLAANKEISAPYGNRLIDSYTRFTRLAEGEKRTLTTAEVKKIVRKSCELEAERNVNDGEYDTISDALMDTWVSNYVYTREYSSMSRVYDDVTREILNLNNNDGDIINEIMLSAGAHYDYDSALDFYENVLTPITGIDGFHYVWKGNDENGIKNDIYLAFHSEQIKSADPVTYDDAGNVIPLSERFNPENNDIRYSREEWQEDLDRMVEDYGEMEPGEKPYRDITLPNKTEKNKNVSQTVRTVLEAKATTDAMVDNIEELVSKGDFSYEVYGDKEAIYDAKTRIRDLGWDKSLELWKKSVQNGKVTKKSTALGWALYNNAATDGNTATAIDILNNMVEHQRNAAQALQATRILKKMQPETQLYGVARSVRNLQEELNERYGDEKSPKLEIDQGLAEHFMKAKTDAERAKALQDIYVDIGRQMPSRFVDKVNAWRYLAMLGNPRTHIRNILGNAFFAPVVEVKNLTATAIESAVSRVTRIDRTKAIVSGKGGKELLSAAWSDYNNISDEALGGGKYSDLVNENKYIEEGKQVFKTKALEAARRANSAALEAEDQWFSQPHYAYAMAQYCKANGIAAEQIKAGKGLEKARAYAIKEAQKATYRDTNNFSQFVSNLGRSRMMSKNSVTKTVGVLVEGILPFRKTPANILVRGMEYSPFGLIKSLTADLKKVKSGNITVSEAIDNISAGLTGTGLLSLGAFLASQGLIRGSGNGDDKEKEFEDLTGHQDYALELPGGVSVTLDWLAPESLPFFVGVNLWEQTGAIGEGVTLDTVLNSITNVSEPLLEMSCLQSLNDLFESFQYAQSTNGLGKTVTSAATSYLTQFVPTILGQVERTTQQNRMTTYTSKTGFLNNTDVQYFLGGVSAKVPGWDYRQIEYIDAWGRTESSGGIVKRALNNFLNPAYMSDVEISDMENELMRLYETTGENVFPSRAGKSIKVDGKDITLSPKQYTDYATQKGIMSYQIVTSLTESKAYKNLNDSDKAKTIQLAYDYANQTAKYNVVGYSADKWVTSARNAYEKYQLPISTYILVKSDLADVESIKDKNGNSINNSSSLLKMQKLYTQYPNLSSKQREYLFESFDIGKSVIGYSKGEVNSAIQSMRGK